jgi:hypothetical protein
MVTESMRVVVINRRPAYWRSRRPDENLFIECPLLALWSRLIRRLRLRWSRWSSSRASAREAETAAADLLSKPCLDEPGTSGRISEGASQIPYRPIAATADRVASETLPRHGRHGRSIVR